VILLDGSGLGCDRGVIQDSDNGEKGWDGGGSVSLSGMEEIERHR
jgi:hypothetical protein